jgi:hypothetical protein
MTSFNDLPGTYPLMATTDDLNTFISGDPTFFLTGASEVIRRYLQWHVYPSITVTDTVPVAPDGTIFLPSLYVTDVASVTLNGIVLDPSTYVVHQEGFIDFTQQNYWPWPLWPLESDLPFREYPSPLAVFADVTYTHGFPQIPVVINVITLELAANAQQLPSGPVQQITAGPQTIVLGELGLLINDEQKNRLGPFKLVRF